MEYTYLFENREDAIYALNFDDRPNHKEKPILKDSYFFFGQWQGYIFYFFDCASNQDDPPVYVLTDDLFIKKYKDTFSDFIKDEGVKTTFRSQIQV